MTEQSSGANEVFYKIYLSPTLRDFQWKKATSLPKNTQNCCYAVFHAYVFFQISTKQTEL